MERGLDQILSSLNIKQHDAVTAPVTSPLQIRAGPGTGKTKVLVARVAYLLLHHRIPPQNIVVTTFTKKAAKEMVERLAVVLQGSGISPNKLLVGTFHSISYGIIQKYGAADGLVGFSVSNEKDSAQLLSDVINALSDSDWNRIMAMPKADLALFVKLSEAQDPQNLRRALDKKRVMRQISKLKSHALFPGDYAKRKDANFLLAEVYSRYQQSLYEHKLLDFDDCLLYCYRILSQRQVLRFIEHTLVDEFQDTNEIQLQLMFQFAKLKKSDQKVLCGVTIVGDPDQSIYAFRDAQVGNFEKMLLHYAKNYLLKCSSVVLTDNYRSTTDILAISELVMRQQHNRAQKELVSQISPSLKPVKMVLTSSEEEARWVAYQIENLISLPKKPIEYSEIAVLVRCAFQTRVLESEFAKRKIPYTIVKGRAFWERKEVTSVLDYLRCVVNPDDCLALFRCINYPKRGFGPVAISELERLCKENVYKARLSTDIRDYLKLKGKENQEESQYLHLDVLAAIARGDITSSLTGKLLESLEEFLKIIKKTRELTNEGFLEENGVDSAECLGKAFDYLLSSSGLQKELSDDENKALNVAEVKAQLMLFEEPTPEDAFPELEEVKKEIENIEVIDDLESEIEITELEVEATAVEAVPEGDRGQRFLGQFLALVILYETDNSTQETDQPKVAISTIHGAKGLEWPVVFVPGVSEGLLPASFALGGTEDALDEERRCLYVGLTRAKILLYVSAYTEAASSSWGRKPIEKVSRFIANLDCLFSETPFESEASVRYLYRILGRGEPTNFEFTDFNNNYVEKLKLYVKQTTDIDDKAGFVTGPDIRRLGWTDKRSVKRSEPRESNTSPYAAKRTSCAPFKPVYTNRAPLNENYVEISKPSKLMAPTYIPQRAKHKRRLGTR